MQNYSLTRKSFTTDLFNKEVGYITGKLECHDGFIKIEKENQTMRQT